MSGSKRTYKALFARGVDTLTAKELVEAGHTLSSLQQQTRSQLEQLGIGKVAIDAIHNSKRPPIPPGTVERLLCDSRRICCCCRERDHPVIIHHIEPWHTSRDHDESNLVVLCLHCHCKAHTKSDLAIDLTADQIRYNKRHWYQQVQDHDRRALLSEPPTSFTSAMWDYFNHRRLFDVAREVGVNIGDCDHYEELVADGFITPDGAPNASRALDNLFLYEGLGFFDRRLYCFNENVLEDVLAKTNIVNLTDRLTRASVNSLVSVGSVITSVGGWRFRREPNPPDRGPGQLRTGYVQKRKVRIEFVIDAWEGTSSSSSYHFSNVWHCTPLCIVRGVERHSDTTKVDTTCLAIGTGFKKYVADSAPPVTNA